ncbi:hypothetical protein LINPERHAP1_LOCUS22895 [Linum perenne]
MRFVPFPKGYRVCYLHVYLELVDSETMPGDCRNRGLINLINGANFWVTAIVELLGLVICLHVATKVSFLD